jgi:hypothetical protein
MSYEQPSADHPVTLPDGASFNDQIALGNELKHRYNIRTVEDSTSCSTCHR